VPPSTPPPQNGWHLARQSGWHLPEGRLQSGWHLEGGWWLVVAAVAGMVLAHHDSLFARAPLFDERIYLGAFARRLAGGSAWADPWFLYPPPFAAAGAGLLRLFGETGLLALLRALNLAAVALLVTRGVAFLPGGRWTRRLVAAAIGALSPAIGDAFAFGNLSPLFGALALLPLAWASRAPAVAGGLLGAAIVAKPTGAVLLPLLAAARGRLRRRAAFVAAAVAALLLAATARELPAFLAAASEAAAGVPRGSLSPVEIVRLLGLRLSPFLLFAVVALAAAAAARRVRDGGGLLLLGAVAAPLSLPLVWSHTLLLTLPVQGAALGAALDDVRNAAPGTSRRRAGLTLAALLTACLALHTAYGLAGGAAGLAPPLQALLLALPTFSPLALLLWLAGRRRHREDDLAT